VTSRYAVIAAKDLPTRIHIAEVFGLVGPADPSL
jgi:hypothetical protein